MLQIACPSCGVRDEDEYTYGGPWQPRRPADPSALNDAEWSAYLFGLDNPRGFTLERWRHTFGCRQWFVIERDTVSHAVVRTITLDALRASVACTAALLTSGVAA